MTTSTPIPQKDLASRLQEFAKPVAMAAVEGQMPPYMVHAIKTDAVQVANLAVDGISGPV